MRLFVVGTGSIGRRHLRNLLGLGHEVLIWDADSAQLDGAAVIGGVAMPDLASGLAARPDGVLICTPPASHLTLAEAALRAGAHVFLEKPLAATTAGVDDLLAAAAEGQRHVLVGCNLRFFRSLQRVKRMLEEGRIGRLLSIRAACGFYLPFWRPGRDYRELYSARAALGGGILLDAIHEFDYLRWLGGEVREVFCTAGRLSDLAIDVEDVAEVTLRFASGALGQVHLDYLQRSYRRSCELIGETGVIVWDYIRKDITVFSPDPDRWEGLREPIDTNHDEMFVEEMRHFVRCIEGEEKPVVDGREGLRALQLVEAARESSGNGRWVAV